MFRRILHIDMDAFYASVEQRDNRRSSGSLAVGGQPDRRGVVCAASYEARAYWVRSAMSMARAVLLCPDLVIVRPDFPATRQHRPRCSISFALSPLVEPLARRSVSRRHRECVGEPMATKVARRLKNDIREATGLTASAGVAPNRFLAKIASGWKKPDGLTVISP